MDCSPFLSIDEEQMCKKPNREMPALLYFQHIDLSLSSEIELNLIWIDTNVDCGTYNFNRNHYKSVHNPVNIDKHQMSWKDLTNSATRYNFCRCTTTQDVSICLILLTSTGVFTPKMQFLLWKLAKQIWPKQMLVGNSVVCCRSRPKPYIPETLVHFVSFCFVVLGYGHKCAWWVNIITPAKRKMAYSLAWQRL